MAARLFLFAVFFVLNAQAQDHAKTADKKRPPPGPPITEGMKIKFDIPEELEDRKLLGPWDKGEMEMNYFFVGGEVKKFLDPTKLRVDMYLNGPGDKFRLDLIRPVPIEPPETSRLRKGSFTATAKPYVRESEVAGKKYYGNYVKFEFEHQGLKGNLSLAYFTADKPYTFTFDDLKRSLGTNVLVEIQK